MTDHNGTNWRNWGLPGQLDGHYECVSARWSSTARQPRGVSLLLAASWLSHCRHTSAFIGGPQERLRSSCTVSCRDPVMWVDGSGSFHVISHVYRMTADAKVCSTGHDGAVVSVRADTLLPFSASPFRTALQPAT